MLLWNCHFLVNRHFFATFTFVYLVWIFVISDEGEGEEGEGEEDEGEEDEGEEDEGEDGE